MHLAYINAVIYLKPFESSYNMQDYLFLMWMGASTSIQPGILFFLKVWGK